jgi:hypothetical protein
MDVQRDLKARPVGGRRIFEEALQRDAGFDVALCHGKFSNKERKRYLMGLV